MKRRNVIKGLSLLPFAGGAIGSIIPSSFAVAAPGTKKGCIYRTWFTHIYQCSRHLYCYDRIVDAGRSDGGHQQQCKRICDAG